MISNLALLLVVFPSGGSASVAVKGLIFFIWRISTGYCSALASRPLKQQI